MGDCKTIQNKALRLREDFYLKIKELDSTVDGFLSVDDINDPSIVKYQLADAALEIDLIEKYQSESDSCGNGNLESAVNRLEYHLDHLKEDNPMYDGGFGCSEPIRPPKFRGASYRTFFESSCPVLNEYPPDIDYQKDTDEFTNPGLQLEAGPAVMSASDDVANCVGKSNGGGLDWFRCLDTVLHEKLTFKDNDNKIARRKADDILTDGDASGCNDFGISATAILRNLGYETLCLSTARNDFLQGKSEDIKCLQRVWRDTHLLRSMIHSAMILDVGYSMIQQSVVYTQDTILRTYLYLVDIKCLQRVQTCGALG